MSEERDTVDQPPRRRRLWLRIVAGLAALLLVVFGVAWWQRVQIADNFLGRELAKRGVDARYRIANIGFFRQRIENLSIGDRKRPDLTAEWVEVDTGFTLNGPVVTGVRVGPALLRARLADGKVSLGEVDKLMGPPSDKPFSLPALYVSIADGRIALETPYGPAAIGVKGSGRLNDGFAGRLTATSPRIAIAECAAERIDAAVDIRIRDAQPTLRGPVRAASAACPGIAVSAPRVDVATALDAALAKWQGRARVAATSLVTGYGRAAGVAGTIEFAGSAAATKGRTTLSADRVALAQGSASGVGIRGDFALGNAGSRFTGSLAARDAALSPTLRQQVSQAGGSGDGTPLGPLLAQAARAGAAAARGGRLEASLTLASNADGTELRLGSAQFAAASGAKFSLDRGDGLVVRSPGGTTFNGTIAMRGGGLPDAVVQLTQRAPGAPMQGLAQMLPYSAGDARLALEPVRFVASAGGLTRISTRVTLSGPFSGGRIDGLQAPVEARWNGRTLILNPECVPVAFTRLQLSSLDVGRTRLKLCPAGPAIAVLQGGRLSGGVRVDRPRLAGRIGGSPLTLSADIARYDLGASGFTLANVAARIGEGTVTQLDVARLDGRMSGGALSGAFEGADGQIGSVPLRMTKGAGDWRFADSRLELTGGVQVDDTAEAPRFNTLRSDDVRLSLDNGRIAATGTLTTPVTAQRPRAVKVADVTIDHDLSTGTGSALLDVPGIRFREEGFQPRDLTELTYGVIAAVSGQVSGQGRIRWNGEGVTSDGDFRTAGTDLSAAFGSVNGLATEVHFTDLLNMQTAPGQVATVVGINPGLPVEDGTIRYRLLDATRVQIESASWPFAGGLLELEPTLLDFSENKERRMTFRLTGIDAARFLQEMDYANLDATGVFDGVLPVIFDANGGRIEGGRLAARGNGSIAYVGEISQRDVGMWGNMAFQALKSLNYKSLTLEMNGSLAGDIVTEIRFAGISQGEGAKSNFILRRLQRLPFVFNVTIRAPFRQLLDSVQSYYDPSLLIERNLPALIEEQKRQTGQTIQPSESETVP